MRYPEFDTALADDAINEGMVKEFPIRPESTTGETAGHMSTDAENPENMSMDDGLDENYTTPSEPSPFLTTDSSTFTIIDKKPRLSQSFRINNIPPLAIGFLDLANSGDFAANVFNQIPVPIYAAILMVIGAACALLMSFVTFKDARRSWRNIRLLRAERRMLLVQGEEGAASLQSFAIELDLNHRDLWTEIFDRGGMEVMMGTAAFIIAVGTFMAPAGAHPKVFKASNLLSGYIGNAPAAAYGLITATWSVHVWFRAHRQSRAAKTELEDGCVLKALRRRIMIVQGHAVMTGIVCLVSGVLSMFTPTSWWPYPVLAVCGIAFIYGTYVYKTQIGYERPQILAGVRIEKDVLLRELAFVASMRELLQNDAAVPEKSSIDFRSLSSLLITIVRCDLFEYFSQRLIQDHDLYGLLNDGDQVEVHLTPELLVTLAEKHQTRVCEIARKCLEERGLKQLSYRERFLLEALGSCLAVPHYHAGNMRQRKS